MNSYNKESSNADSHLYSLPSVIEIMRFAGPCWISNDNYGLYLGEDLQRAVFMYRDHISLKLNYYNFRNKPFD